MDLQLLFLFFEIIDLTCIPFLIIFVSDLCVFLKSFRPLFSNDSITSLRQFLTINIYLSRIGTYLRSSGS